MAIDFFDIIFVADPRFAGGTSTALAAEVKAAAKAGLSVAVKPVLSPLLRLARPFHPKLLQDMAQTGATLLGPGAQADCRFAVLHHPMVFDRLPAEPLGITAEHAVLVLHHPPKDGAGRASYDLAHVLEIAAICIGTKVWLAPVGPLVRAQLNGWQHQTLEQDWTNLIDLDEWPDQSARVAAPLGDQMRIGRHSRPHPPKWPATLDQALAVYGRQPWLSVSMLGADGGLLAQKYGRLPEHWRLIPFGQMAAQDYLAGLDAWVFFHDPLWVEAFGRAILEAAGSGLPVILPPHFKQVFGPACLYCEAGQVPQMLQDLRADDQARGEQARRARAHVEASFSLARYPERLARIDPEWGALHKGATPPSQPDLTQPDQPGPMIRRQRPARVMYMCSNGVGLGHLTRLLAIADAEPTAPLPVFFTLSRGAGFVRDAGFPCEYMPFHRGQNVDLQAWNANLAQALISAADFHDAGSFVFDGNMPYEGVLGFLRARPHLRSVWCRRGFWREGHAEALTRGEAFSLILQPGDIAQVLDNGPTVKDRRSNLMQVPPIWRDQGDLRLDRDQALGQLGLDPARRYVLVSLGSKVNYDLGDLPRLLLAGLKARGFDPVLLRSPLEPSQPGETPDATVHLRAVFPVSPLLAAFDFAVSAAGYNSFHEFFAHGLPTIWVPNEAAEMDRQEDRAHFAHITGAGTVLRAGDDLRLAAVLDQMADADRRAQMRQRCLALTPENGAGMAARMLLDLSSMVLMKP